MDAGKLVPDEVVIGIIKERLAQDDCKNGFILDGFPRTIPQAEALDKMGVVIDKVIDIEVAGREDRPAYVRTPCLRSMRRHLPPALQKAGRWRAYATNAAGTLVQRKDDHPDTVKERLEVYHEQTEPLKAYYEKQGKLYIVEGQEEVADTTKLTLAALEA